MSRARVIGTFEAQRSPERELARAIGEQKDFISVLRGALSVRAAEWRFFRAELISADRNLVAFGKGRRGWPEGDVFTGRAIATRRAA